MSDKAIFTIHDTDKYIRVAKCGTVVLGKAKVLHNIGRTPRTYALTNNNVLQEVWCEKCFPEVKKENAEA